MAEISMQKTLVTLRSSVFTQDLVRFDFRGLNELPNVIRNSGLAGR
jgi:hypothetical protein